MLDAERILDTGVAIARKHDFARHRYQSVRYGKLSSLEEILAEDLALYGVMRLEGFDRARFSGTDAALALRVLHGLDGHHATSDLPDAPLALAYHYAHRHYRLGEYGPRTLLATLVHRLLHAHPRTADGILCLSGERFRVELLLARLPFLAMAGTLLGRSELHEEAVRQFYGLRTELFDEPSGFYHHARNWFREDQVTPDHWARGNGYAAAGLAELLRHLPEGHPASSDLRQKLDEHLTALVAVQTDAGLFRQDLSDEASYEETSGSALIVYALATALHRGWIGERFRERVERGWNALSRTIELPGNANIRGASGPTEPAMDPEYYRARPVELNAATVFGPLLLAAGGCYQVATVQEWNRPVEARAQFERPAAEAVRKFLARCHEICEGQYNGDGSWGNGTADDAEGTFREILKESRSEHPIVRYSGFAAMGYLAASAAEPNESYSRRAGEALEWLLRNQEPDGSYRLWTRHAEGQADMDACLFDTGIAGSALVAGYEHTGDPALLAASALTARLESDYLIVWNTNFNAFAVWHLARHYEISADEDALAAAVHRVRHAMLCSQQPSGGWVGHNSMVWYHGINVRAYACLLRVLPEGHGLRNELLAALKASIAVLGSLQQADGSLLHRPGSTETAQLYSEIIVALVDSLRVVDDEAVRQILDGVVSYRMSPEAGDPDRMYNQEKGYWIEGWSSSYVYAYGVYEEFAGDTNENT
mgnify:FL=1